jgi:hypothetical protein
MTRSSAVHPLIPVTALATVAIGLGVGIAHQHAGAAVSGTGPVEAAGIAYDAQGARVLNEAGDAAVIRALPSDERRSAGDRVLYGVFITLHNGGGASRPMSRRFALIDADLHSFTPIPLRGDSAFAYRARDLAGGQVAPPAGSAPAGDYAEQGYPLVFRIPRANARDGDLTLRVFDPTGATPPADTIVQTA